MIRTRIFGEDFIGCLYIFLNQISLEFILADQIATNIIWHQSEVNQAAREELLKQ